MNLQKLYTILRVADMAAAEAWYTKVLGRRPDTRPRKTLVQWEFDQGSIGLSSDDLIARTGAMFLIVADLAAERRRLKEQGIALGDDMNGDYSTLAQLRDPDGNLITLATIPAPPYPPA
jgi:catechol 2,3-dioxygenase-like lactoylglutathione lyase family enzyme